jgi:hypothetical protein
MELFTATGKLKKVLLTIRDVRCLHHRSHGTHRYDIQVLATHASTWMYRYSSLLQLSVPARSRGNFGTTKFVPPLPRDLADLQVHTSNISSCKKKFSFLVAVNNSIKVGLLGFLL